MRALGLRTFAVAAAAAVVATMGGVDAAAKPGPVGQYSFQTHPGLTSSFGWEGDRHAPIAFIDGSYQLRDRDNTMITFGVPDIPGKIEWRNAEGYLPAFISRYAKDGLEITVESFADEEWIDGKRYEIAYSRMITKNTTRRAVRLPAVSGHLIPLNREASTKVIRGGETVVRDYAVAADRFGSSYAWPTSQQVAARGGYDQHYREMKDYWNNRVSAIAQIDSLPNRKLIDAYKAGYIYTLLIRDDIEGRKELHVGENGYDIMFDHDTIGIVATLLTVGDFRYAQEYLETLPAQLQYDDAKWKYSWPYALYLQRTGDAGFVKSRFAEIKKQTHTIETDRIDGGRGIIKRTNAIDSEGFWTIDNWSALTGLTTYRYLAEQLGETAEAQWAQAQYDDLFRAASDTLARTISEKKLDYLPMSMVESNEEGPRSDPRDANWASMFLFGRWAWDGHLFGARQSGVMLDKIDDTYAYGAARRAPISDSVYNFGGYPHGYYSSAYNAGYGSAALRGERHRDVGIKAYEFMIDRSMSGPFGWWEGVDYPNPNSPWNIPHAAGGGGSNQHMWGQSTATKVLFDSMIAQRSDRSLIIGRGLPQEWLVSGRPATTVRNYPVADGGRIGFQLTPSQQQIDITLSGDLAKAGEISIEPLGLANNIARVSTPGAVVDQAAGTVRVPAGTQQVTITLRHRIG